MDILRFSIDNCDMAPSTEQTVRDYKKTSEAFRRKIASDPKKAKEALVRAGIVKETRSDIKLAPRYRPAG
jgi:hypothetical protein